MNWQAIWNSIRTNPYIVAAWTAFAGALGSQLYTYWTTGNVDWTSKATWSKMLISAASVAITAVVHLLTPSQGQQQALKTAASTSLKIVALLICLLVLPLTACNSVSTSTPTAPAVTALDVLNQVQGDVLAVQSAEIAAVQAGLIDATTNTVIQKALKQEAIDATAVATAISSAATTATVQTKVDALLADLQNDVTNGALGIKDAKTRGTVITSISVAEIAVNGIMGAYNAGK